ncbi:Predicted small periplasmic lipoprotein [Actinobacillus porcinus]|uniref:Predicted small periplasmic lipoprotein n=1 Tax=Actinobacillus porcinus TaxID=51048 RepID=A0ABY6TNK0_9PAST|nr:Predicted small periplasmic lipoprotein [Actinobacillus porcinus]VTU08885.1 Predicted small periplasmic lipoprotein [Actinobacillus porcinus]
MKKRISLLVLTALCSLLTACGVKGPLYFPAEDAAQNQPQQLQQEHQQQPNQTQPQ